MAYNIQSSIKKIIRKKTINKPRTAFRVNIISFKTFFFCKILTTDLSSQKNLLLETTEKKRKNPTRKSVFVVFFLKFYFSIHIWFLCGLFFWSKKKLTLRREKIITSVCQKQKQNKKHYA